MKDYIKGLCTELDCYWDYDIKESVKDKLINSSDFELTRNSYKDLLKELEIILIYEIDAYNNYEGKNGLLVKRTLERILDEINILKEVYIDKECNNE